MTDRDAELWDRVALRAVVGSRAHGLDEAGSDTDRRGFYLPPARRHWSLAGVPDQLVDDAEQAVYFETAKFLRLVLNANPNVLEALWSPQIEHATPAAMELIDLRGRLLSRRVADAFGGFAGSQHRRLLRSIDAGRTPNPKHVMHLVRLLLAGLDAVRDGRLWVRVPEEHRAELVALRRGEFDLRDVDRRQRTLRDQLDAVLPRSPLPIEPDVAAADAWLVAARRSALDWA